jgi:type I restriction enzyme S subunit
MKEWQDAGWPAVRIRDIGKLYSGGTPSRRKPEFFEGKIPWITSQDIPENYVATISKGRDHITPAAVEESATRVAAPGAVLVTTRVSVGKTAVAGVRLCFSQDVTAIELHTPSVAMPAFVAHFLRSRRKALLQKNQGSTIGGLTRDSLALERIPLPPLSEQRRIVEILEDAEAIRQLQAQADALALELIPAFFRSMFGDVERNPKGWKKVRIADLVRTFEGGKSLAGTENPYLRTEPRVLKISAVTTGAFDAAESKPLPAGYEPPVAHYVRAGDLLISRANTEALIGATALVPEDCPRSKLVLPDKIWRFVWKPGFVGAPEFVWALFQEPGIRRMIRRIASGTGGSMKNISMGKLMQLRVIWPPEELQWSFAEIVKEGTFLRTSTRNAELVASLGSSLTFVALTGQATAGWRQENRDALELETSNRDATLEAASVTRSLRPRNARSDFADQRELDSDASRAELNREQKDLLAMIHENFDRPPLMYFTARMLSASVKGPLGRNAHAVEGHLGVLAAQGLIVPVGREEQTEDTGEFIFGNAYRLPLMERSSTADGVDERRPGDRVRLRELQRLGRRIAAGVAQP